MNRILAKSAARSALILAATLPSVSGAAFAQGGRAGAQRRNPPVYPPTVFNPGRGPMPTNSARPFQRPAAPNLQSNPPQANGAGPTVRPSAVQPTGVTPPKPLTPQQQQQNFTPVANPVTRADQLPAVKPRITYSHGMLTIVAQNSTFADIIAGLRSVAGIKIEAPPSGDRVAAKIGPAPARDVLLSLFDGSPYDYIILGDKDQPGRVDHVILTQRTAFTEAQQAAQPPLPDRGNPEESITDEDGSFVPVQQVDQAPDTGQTPIDPQTGMPVQNGQYVPPQNPPNQVQGSPFGVPDPNGQPQTNPDPNAVKTPQELMQELQQMQRRNQQQQDQQPPNNNPR